MDIMKLSLLREAGERLYLNYGTVISEGGKREHVTIEEEMYGKRNRRRY